MPSQCLTSGRMAEQELTLPVDISGKDDINSWLVFHAKGPFGVYGRGHCYKTDVTICIYSQIAQMAIQASALLKRE